MTYDVVQEGQQRPGLVVGRVAMERHRLAQEARHELAQPLGGIELRRVDQVAHKRRSCALCTTINNIE
jgi:hypothetical protein